jgi:uncharacterized membrane protein
MSAPSDRSPSSDGDMRLNAGASLAALAHILTIAAFVLSVMLRAPPAAYAGYVVAVAAAALAYSLRRAAMPWAATHYEHALRTLIIGYLLWAFAAALQLIHGALISVVLYLQLAVALWAVVRAAIALFLALTRRAIPHPRGWLI